MKKVLLLKWTWKMLLARYDIPSFLLFFLNLVLRTILFGNPWIAPLINGRPDKFFKSSRGLIHGFPLSPFLYIIKVDTLSRKLKQARQSGHIKGISFVREVKDINHS